MPRSPSRDLSDRYIGRRGYFRTPDAIRKGKYALALIALFGAVGWAAVDVAQPSRANYGHSHGPLANPHAAFDDNCKACHFEYTIKDLGLFSAFNARERWHNLTCDKCHSGPPHHETTTDEGLRRHQICSNCHHDHQGRLFSLVRLNDRDCNACHADLEKWRDPARVAAAQAKAAKTDFAYDGPYVNKVTSFVTDHPPFRSLGEEKEGDRYVIGPPKAKPRTLTFSHAVHMNPGQSYDKDGNGGEAMTVGKLRELGGEAAVARYAPGAGDGDKVQLACASCHTLDSGQGTEAYQRQKDTLGKGDPTRALLPPRADGAYFLPVNYEAACRSCHPLSAPEGVVAEDGKREVLPRFDLPHRRQAAEISDLLKAGYVKALLASGQVPRVKVAPPAEPGLPPELPPIDKDAVQRRVEELTRKAEGILLTAAGTCAKCHATERGNGGTAFNIKPVPDRTVWLTHAKFNHASHRGATCTACHPGTAGADRSPADAEKPEPVQILGLESCRTCHSPTSAKVSLSDGTTAPGGGVRSNCTDCHRYHHGDQPLQGRGSQSWYPNKPRTIEDWLKGK